LWQRTRGETWYDAQFLEDAIGTGLAEVQFGSLLMDQATGPELGSLGREAKLHAVQNRQEQIGRLREALRNFARLRLNTLAAQLERALKLGN
jgi:hypothetical protein